jgi:hypothetical protein
MRCCCCCPLSPQILKLSNGSSVSQHAFVAEQLLQQMSAHADCASSCVVWGKADTVIKHLQQVSEFL